MTHEEAARILDPETSRDALCEIEYYGGFRGEEARLEACNEACRVAAKVLREPQAVRLDETGAQALALAAEVSELRQRKAAGRGLSKDCKELANNLRNPTWFDLEEPGTTLLDDAATAITDLLQYKEAMCKCKPKTCGCAVWMTNADRIRSMSDEDLAKFLCHFRSSDSAEHPCNGCEAEPYCRPGHTGMIDWLQQPVEEDNPWT